MGSWNYRVVRRVEADEQIFTIREVHYDDAGNISAIAVEPVAPVHVIDGEDDTASASLSAQLRWMEAALQRPTIDEETLEEIEDL